jgi:hypothetical protein
MPHLNQNRPKGITVVAMLMIIFGVAEIATGFTHSFLGIISTQSVGLATYSAAGIGALYAVGGLLILTMQKRAAALAMVCLAAVIIGRVFLVLTDLYPVNSFLQTLSIVVGTTIAIIFAVYISLQWRLFR